MDNSIVPIIQELEKTYCFLAKRFKLKSKPLITIQSKGRQKETLGWYWNNKWQKDKVEFGEINICAESLNKNPIETLIHEMVHYTNDCEKIKDCNNQNYHNKKFKEKAEIYGLNVEKSGRHGWAITSLSNNLDNIIKQANINYKVFKLYRKNRFTVTAPTKMKKYNCGCTTIRCATNLQAKCLNCNNEFTEEEK